VQQVVLSDSSPASNLCNRADPLRNLSEAGIFRVAGTNPTCPVRSWDRAVGVRPVIYRPARFHRMQLRLGRPGGPFLFYVAGTNKAFTYGLGTARGLARLPFPSKKPCGPTMRASSALARCLPRVGLLHHRVMTELMPRSSTGRSRPLFMVQDDCATRFRI